MNMLQSMIAISGPREFKLDEQTYQEFVSFVRSRGFDFQTKTEQQIDRLEEEVQKVGDEVGLASDLEQTRQHLQDQKLKDLTTYQTIIAPSLKRAIISRYYFSTGVLEASFVDDKDILKAVEVLNDSETYDSILKENK